MRYTVAAWIMLAVGGTLATPMANNEHTNQVGWTHEEYLEYLTLDTTNGWAGMSKVTFYNSTTLDEHIDFSSSSASLDLDKRSGGRTFLALQGDYPNCQGSVLLSASNFNCGVCVNTCCNIAAQYGYLTRQYAGNPYPTADWFKQPNCGGSKIHHQGIVGSQLSSCDDANYYGSGLFRSVMLYQGC